MTPYYQDDHVTIYHGDCLDLLAGIEADVMITDPPYLQETHDNIRSWGDIPGKHSDAERVTFSGITPDYLRRVVEVASPRRWVVMTLDITLSAHLIFQPPSGYEFVRQSVWVKPRGAPQMTGDRPAMWWEPIMHFHPPGKKHWNGGGRANNYMLDSDRNTAHPTSKPLQMIRSLVELFSDDGDLVVDPFMGSGTTLRAAKDLGRRAIGIEIEERYCEIAARRCAQEVLAFG